MEIGCTRATTPTMVYSTKVLGEHMAKMIDWKVGNDVEVQNTKEKVSTMKGNQEDTKGEGMPSSQGCNINRTPLTCLDCKIEVLEASFG